MVSNCAFLGAQSRELTATANLSKGGDSIYYDFITATVPQSSSFSEQLWDFSNSKYLGQEKEVFFVGNDSNRIKMIDKDAILDFSQDKEHLLLKHLQTPLLNIDFGNSFEYLKFPFSLNDSLTCQIEGKGTYCSKNKLVFSGTCCTKTMAKGKYQFEGGYCSFDNNLNPTYHYYEKDHLGSIRMVVNENGTIEQVNHYYPFGGVYGDLAYNSELQKNKYIGKEFDHTSGLDWYDHGARMYDAAKGSWDRMDALHSNHYNFNPYSYSGNNPILFVDKDGLDWYRENGIYMYSPDIHSGKDLKKDQTYMGKSFSIGNGNNKANYQKDGSVLFANETQAYNYIWKVANHHKREVGGFLLNDNKVLVMPEYKNDASTTKLDEYGYSFKGRSLSNSSGTTYNVKAQIHSHQDRYGSPEPSYTGGSTYYGDGGLSMYHKALPIFVMGHNDILYVIRGIRKKDAPHFHWTDWGKQSRTSLLNGKIKLSKEINILNNIKL